MRQQPSVLHDTQQINYLHYKVRKARREIGTRRWLALLMQLQLKLHPINPCMIPLISTFPPSSFSTEAVPSWPWSRVHEKRSDEVRAGNQNKTSSHENTLPTHGEIKCLHWQPFYTYRKTLKLCTLPSLIHFLNRLPRPFYVCALSSWFIDWCMLENILWIMIISELYQCSFVFFVIVS